MQHDGRKKRTAKPLFVTNVTGLLLPRFVVFTRDFKIQRRGRQRERRLESEFAFF